MKKIYFLLVAMLVGFAANAADYYLIGGALGWGLKNEKGHFTDKGNGIYELKFQGAFTSGFKINDGTWSNDNANFGSNGSNLVIGTPYAYGVGGSTGNINFEGSVTNPTLTLDINNGTILVAGEAQESKVAYCIHGGLTSADWGNTDLTDTDNDGIWTVENVEVTLASAGFGIRSYDEAAGHDTQIDWIGADGASSITGPGTFKCKVNGTDFSIAKGTYGFSFNPETMVLTVTGESQGGDDPQPSTHDVILAVSSNGFDAANGHKFTTTDNKIYTLKLEGDFSDSFKVVADNKWWGTRTPMESGIAYTLEDTGMDNCKLASAAIDPEFVYDFDNNTLTVTYKTNGDDPDPEDYSGWYLNVYGPFNEWEDNGVELNTEGKAEITDLAIDANGFKIKIYNGTTKKDEHYVYTDGEIVPGTPTVIYLDAYNADPMKIEGAGDGTTYNVSFDYPTKTMVVTKAQSGVEVIEAENAAAEYFNLQGVKVAEPTQGLYIVRRGNTVTKEIVK